MAKPRSSAFELRRNATYRVIAAFVDYDGNTHEVGERWTFIQDFFLPYEDGLSLYVDLDGRKADIRLQDRGWAQAHVIRAFSDFVVEE